MDTRTIPQGKAVVKRASVVQVSTGILDDALFSCVFYGDERAATFNGWLGATHVRAFSRKVRGG